MRLGARHCCVQPRRQVVTDFVTIVFLSTSWLAPGHAEVVAARWRLSRRSVTVCARTDSSVGGGRTSSHDRYAVLSQMRCPCHASAALIRDQMDVQAGWRSSLTAACARAETCSRRFASGYTPARGQHQPSPQSRRFLDGRPQAWASGGHTTGHLLATVLPPHARQSVC